MADGPALALQRAVIVRLRSFAGVTALVGQRVYDEPPQRPDGTTDYPYVRFGAADQAALWMTCGADDDVTFSVEVHSRPSAGRVEALRIAHQLRLALDQADLTLTGWHLDWLDYQTQALTRAPDGRSYVAVVAFAAALSPMP